MRWFRLLAVVGCVAALFAACGGTASKPHTPDAGGGPTAGSGTSGSSGCTDDNQCPSGEFCIGDTSKRCGTCDGFRPPVLACPTGTVCNHVTHGCQPLGGSSGTSGSGGSSGSSGTTGTIDCTHRSECPLAEACLPGADGGVCDSPAPDAGCANNDQCTKAFVCQAGQCVYGCYNNLDCHGTQQPVCIPGNPGHCGACTQSGDCFANENCENGQCVPRASCTSSDTCGGLGCVSGYCGPCTQDQDCASGNVCDTVSGKCVAGPSGCTTDAQCQSQHNGGLGWYCDSNNPLPDGGGAPCKLGCVADSACSPTPQIGCCNLSQGQTCDGTTHACVTGGTTATSTGGTTTSGTTNGSSTTGTTTSGGTTTGGCDTASCDQQCQFLNSTCDYSTCACASGGTTTGGGTGGTSGGSCQSGGQLQPCNSDCTCNSGYSCYDVSGGGPYDDSSGICEPFYCSSFLICL